MKSLDLSLQIIAFPVQIKHFLDFPHLLIEEPGDLALGHVEFVSEPLLEFFLEDLAKTYRLLSRKNRLPGAGQATVRISRSSAVVLPQPF